MVAIKVIVSVLFLMTVFYPSRAVAQEKNITEERLEAVVERVIEEKAVEMMGKKQLYQKLELSVTSGSLKNKTITLENGGFPAANVIRFSSGEKVVVSRDKDLEGNDLFYVTDYVRRTPIYWLVAIFAGLTIAVGKLRGLTSLIGMAISFLVIFTLILPQIASGANPVLITITGSLFIIPASFYLSHGFNKKTTVAIVGTLISLFITGILASTFVEVSKLTGFVSEEAGFLQVAKEGLINIKGILLAGIIIGVLGVLDDVTVSQAAVVQQLKKANNTLSAGELFKRAMSVGQDHIASMVNTLVLVYAGAAMPLLLLFVDNPHPVSEIINYEIIAEEFVRTLVGSIGLISAVPITTAIAVFSSKG